MGGGNRSKPLAVKKDSKLTGNKTQIYKKRIFYRTDDNQKLKLLFSQHTISLYSSHDIHKITSFVLGGLTSQPPLPIFKLWKNIAS